jgi:hypothetical protein
LHFHMVVASPYPKNTARDITCAQGLLMLGCASRSFWRCT